MAQKIMANIDVKLGIKLTLSRIEAAYARRSQEIKSCKPTLLAVSKTKPTELLIDAYSTGQRHFGENYAKELWLKGTNESLISQCPDIKWHFIGHLQTNQVNKVLKVPNLYMIETVDSIKLADLLNSKWKSSEPLKVLVQVNTSQEQEKSGIPPNECINLYRHISENCKNLALEGLMTIGAFGHDYSIGPNPDFLCLLECHANVCQTFNLSPEKVHISMGMSDDFEQAIEAGSTIVRVGSSIFGHRPKKGEETHSTV